MLSNHLISAMPFSSCPQSFSASESFLISQLFASGSQSIGASASASVPLMNIQELFSLGWTGLISSLFKGLSRVLQHHMENGWNSPGKNTGEDCHFLLQGIFPTQGWNPGLLHCRQILYPLSHQGNPLYMHECGERIYKNLSAHLMRCHLLK